MSKLAVKTYKYPRRRQDFQQIRSQPEIGGDCKMPDGSCDKRARGKFDRLSACRSFQPIDRNVLRLSSEIMCWSGTSHDRLLLPLNPKDLTCLYRILRPPASEKYQTKIFLPLRTASAPKSGSYWRNEWRRALKASLLQANLQQNWIWSIVSNHPVFISLKKSTKMLLPSKWKALHPTIQREVHPSGCPLHLSLYRTDSRELAAQP